MASAQTDGIWANAASGGLWSDTGNWTGAAVADGSGATAYFNTLDLASDNTVHLDSARIVGNLTFADTVTNTTAGWILDNNGIVANILTLAAGGTPTLTVTALGGGETATISAEIAGVGGLAKAGNGMLSLTASNSYAGATTVAGGGRLIISDASALGTTGDGTTVSGGNQLRLTGGVTFDAEPLTITGNGSPSTTEGRGALRSHSGANTWTGPITIVGGSETWISSSGGFTISGGITGDGQLLRLDQGAPTVTSNPITLGTSGQLSVNSTARLAVSGNTFGTVRIDWGGKLTTEVDGAVPATAVLVLGSLNANPSAGRGTADLSGHDMTIARLMDGGTNYAGEVITNSSATLATLTVNQSVASTYRGVIAGNLALVKDAAGTMTLNGDSTYSGSTLVSDGALVLNGLHTGGGLVTVAGGTLGGTGSVGGVTVQSGGTLAPGGSIGTFASSGDVAILGTLAIELDGTGSGSADLLQVTGALDIGAATVSFTEVTAADDAAYVIASYGSLVGASFASVQGLPAGYQVDYHHGGGNQIAVAVIPEPASLGLMAAAAAALLLRRRRG